MASLKKSVVIGASVEDVFAYVSEPAAMPEWHPNLVEVRDVIGTGAGQQYNWTFKYVGVLLHGQTTVVEYVPNEFVVHQSIGKIESTWTLSVEPHGKDAKFTIEVEYTIPVPVPVLGKLAEHLIVKRDARTLEMALTNVQETLER